MSKSDTPLEEILLRKAYSPPHQPPWAGDKPIHGFDTETADGDIFMLSVAWEGFGGAVIDNDKEILTSRQLWDYLTHKRARSSLNMWYNLDFDANVFLKHVLSEEELAELTVSGNVETPQYEITFVPSKFLKIRDSNRNVYTHYDASQFFYTSLANASVEWLGREKLDETVNVEQFGKDGDSVNQYIADNWSQITKYARIDAELVRDLWVEAVGVGEELGIPMGRPFSTGYLGESYLNATLREKPGMGPRSMAKMAWESYAGGRFEVIKRGDIGPVAGPDINSAYPWVLSELPDPKTLVWERVENPDIETLKEADYGFVNAVVTTDKSRPIQPFAIKLDRKLKYPALGNHEVTTVKEIFTNAYDFDYLEEYEIKEAWLGNDNGGAWYPFDFIDELYTQRKTFEGNGYMKKGMLLKIILNSMYGKMCQTTPKRERVDGVVDLSNDEHRKFVPSLSLPSMIRQKYENGFVEWLEAGSWFNPFLAAYITGMTRLELHKRILEYGLEENTVMLATDSLMVEREPFEESGFATDLVKDGLGNWDYDYRGEAFVIGAGVYQVDFDDGSTKVKTRGFTEADLEKGLKYAAEKANGKLKIESLRPKTVAEAIWQNQQLSEVGQFLEYTRNLSPDMDEKRNWQGEADFDKYLSEVQSSNPINISD